MKAAIFFSATALAVGALADSYIPSGISANCTSFLTSLDSDSGLQTCTNWLLTATKAYSSSNASSSDLTSTLSTLCSSTSSCDNPSIRGLLSNFYMSCAPEMENNNADVIALYDNLYTMMPFRAAICATDATTGGYCASYISSSSGNSRKRSLPTVDGAAMQAAGTPFQFLLPTSPSSDLCTACSKSVMQAWVTWEATLPYPLGLILSPILGGQSALWSAMDSACGSSFMSTITADANAAPLAALASGSAPSTKPVFSALLGVAGLGAALML
ncbi:hypothetical protein DL93DRAFT_2085198 [Clavulina sp. PMI_390]|nr:hypothetical protein DL93DRAFT_2085198 [Clavulina sp. PMI_390]